MSQPAMTCQQLVELVTEYLEGALAPEERTRFDQHLRECEGCTLYVEQMRQAIALTGRLTEQDVPPAAEETLLKIFRDWKRGSTGDFR